MVGHDDLADAVSDVSGEGGSPSRSAEEPGGPRHQRERRECPAREPRAEAMKPIRVLRYASTVRNSAGAATGSRPQGRPTRRRARARGG